MQAYAPDTKLETGVNELRSGGAQNLPQKPRRRMANVARRVGRQIMSDRVALIAAGVSFYFLLALFPALAAFVAIFGLFTDPLSIASQMQLLKGIVPDQGLELIQNQLVQLASQDRDKLSYGLLAAFLFSFWSANSGVKALFQALNIAYGETEQRSFLHVNLLAFTFTFGSMGIAVILIALVGILPALFALLDPEVRSALSLSWLRWPILLVVIGGVISMLYRYGPSHSQINPRWINWGGVTATLIWMAASVVFSYYLENFANYNATYGSLGAVVGFLLWIWLSLVIVIIGCEIDAEMEHARRLPAPEPAP
jgi:membrane protein